MTADASLQAMFGALADPTRRIIVQRVARAGPITATHIARDLPLTRQAISKHLGALEDAGLVRGEQVGRERRFSIVPQAFSATAGWLKEIESEWDTRLAALRSYLELED